MMVTGECDAEAAVQALRAAGTQQEAVARFFEILESHHDRVEDSKRRMEDAYAFRTPSRPLLFFDVAGFAHRDSAWVRTEQDRMLDWQLQANAWQLESLPEGSAVPLLGLGGLSDTIPSMFGAEFDVGAAGAVFPRSYLVSEFPEDVDRLCDTPVDQTAAGARFLRLARFFSEATEGRVRITCPQMQGPLSNVVRLMDQTEALVACAEEPEAMQRFVSRLWRKAIELMEMLHKVVGPALNPRWRFYQPPAVKAVIVDDYVSVIDPRQYLEICRPAYEETLRRLGPIYLHTCGPVAQCAAALTQLPGLRSFETAFVDRNRKSTRDLESLKHELAGKLVIHSFRLPLGSGAGAAVADPENLTRSWLDRMNQGGGFVLQTDGTAEEGRQLLRKLDLL